MEIRFTKMHGLGNDFVVIDDLDGTLELEAAAISWVCNRHMGVGADGLILVRKPYFDERSDYAMVYFNADGTSAEMCGNGVRCFAKWLVDRGLVSGDTVIVQTRSGSREIGVERNPDGTMSTARVDMGEPVFDPLAIPVDLGGAQVLDRPIETEAGVVNVSAVSMGNPHAVIWVDDVDAAPVGTIGPVVERFPAFPFRTNVEFVQLTDEPDHLRLRVWERGVGETLACGTGACAAVAVAVLGCRTGRNVTVELPGGKLTVEWAANGRMYMTGAAVEVFEGVIEIPDAPANRGAASATM